MSRNQDNIIDVWYNDIGVKLNYRTMVYFKGTGIDTYEFNFDGGYINKADVKAFMTNDLTRERVDLTMTFILANRVQLSSVVPVGWTVCIFRDTPKDKPLAKFRDGAVITATNLDRNAQQAVFAVAEMVDRFDSTVADVETALTEVYKANQNSAEAVRKAEEAIAEAKAATVTANKAEAKGDLAIQTANTAEAKGDLAIATANDAKATAEGIDGKAQSALDASAAATVTANRAEATASAADSKSDAAVIKADSAISTADTAKDTAEGIYGKAQSALDASSAATITANLAKATAEAIDGKATTALSTANSAASQVAGATTVANEAKAKADAVDAKAQSALNLATQANTKADGAVTTANSALTKVNKLTNLETVALNVDTTRTIAGTTAFNGRFNLTLSTPLDAGGYSLVMPKSAQADTDISYRKTMWRNVNATGAAGFIETFLEKIDASGASVSRHNLYKYDWTDSRTWPAGLHSGYGTHSFWGKLNVTTSNAALIIRGEAGKNSYIDGLRGGVADWYVGAGGASADIQLKSQVHNTIVNLQSDRVSINKDLFLGSAAYGLDGTVNGSTWGGDLKAWIQGNYLVGIRLGSQVRQSVGLNTSGIAPAGSVLTGMVRNAEGQTTEMYHRKIQMGSGANIWRDAWVI